jgi:hypothetical protein
MKVQFRKIKLGPANRARLGIINNIIEEYRKQGFVLTLRQLYYQLVSRDVVPNNVKEYKKLGNLLKEGRMAGVVDWSAIEDRLRKPKSPNEWRSPEEALETIEEVFALRRQDGQPVYMEVWVEKDALSGVLERVTRPFHVPIMVNRGYSSASAMYDAYRRFERAIDREQSVRIIYLGDFDPSGRDMIRDIEERICEFHLGNNGAFEADDTLAKEPERWRETCLSEYGFDFEIESIALTRAQITKHKPPPNPAKITDSRAEAYIAEHGRSSWEVDALRPEILNKVLTDAIETHLDRDVYDELVDQEEEHKHNLGLIVKHYKDAVKAVTISEAKDQQK